MSPYSDPLTGLLSSKCDHQEESISLPLINNLIHRLKDACYFTKLDICWGYNNVCIHEGDKWKATFCTNRGLFEPLVMYFGLANSLATFQTMMNEIIQDLITEGVVLVYQQHSDLHQLA
jgi:hypothetical protein